MMHRPPCDRDGRGSGLPEPAHYALLDRYWDDLQCRSEGDSWPRSIDRDLASTTVEDLDVLGALHRFRQAVRADGDRPPTPTAWTPDPEDRAGDDCSGPAAVMSDRDGSPPVDGPPDRIGKYPVVEWLGSGGQAEVFRVRHPRLGHELALKLGRRPIAAGTDGGADAEGHDRISAEGRLLARCDHPNLVRIVDLDVHDGRPFVVMQYVPGSTLEQFAGASRPSPRRCARLVAELARAVAYLQDRGIVHQDIKPGNVLVDTEGRPRLIDFGLARSTDARSVESPARPGGTAAYMSPEQAMGRVDRIGPHTDVFGLGGLLYYLLTGRPLYQGASRVSLYRQAIKAEYLPAHRVDSRVPRALERICNRALAADARRRYHNAAELERALRRFLARRWIAAALIVMSVAAVALAAAPRPTAPELTRTPGCRVGPSARVVLAINVIPTDVASDGVTPVRTDHRPLGVPPSSGANQPN